MGILDEPHEPQFVIERISEVDEIINLTQRLISEHPDEESLRLSLHNDILHRTGLVHCLQRSLAYQRHHCLSFTFKDITMGQITVETFANGIKSFSDLIRLTCKELYGETMELRFQQVFSGSVGVVLATPHDDNLLSSDMQAGLNAVIGTIKELGEPDADTKTILQTNLKGKRKLARKFTSFLQQVLAGGSAIAIDWHPVNDSPQKTGISIEKARELHDLFAAHSQNPSQVDTLSGVIKGISLLRNTIDAQINIPGRKKPVTYTNISITEDLVESIKESFDKRANLTIKTEFDYNQTTEIEKPRRILLSVG